MGKRRGNEIIEDRINELFQMALEDDKNGLHDDAHIKYELIFRYSTRYRVKKPIGYNTWVCRKCRYSILNNGGSIRLRKSTLTVRCGRCGYIRRFKINHSSIVSALNSTLYP